MKRVMSLICEDKSVYAKDGDRRKQPLKYIKERNLIQREKKRYKSCLILNSIIEISFAFDGGCELISIDGKKE